MQYFKIIAEVNDRFLNPRSQDFRLPCDMMKYIQKEWSSEAYEKLIRTCKYFYASQPWMVINLSKGYHRFHEILNAGLERNLKIWVAEEPNLPPSISGACVDLGVLTSEDRFSQLLYSIKFSCLKYLTIQYRHLSYSDYIRITEWKSFKILSLKNTDVTTENDENKICFLDDLLKPLKTIETFIFASENGSDFYLECAKRLADIAVSKNLQKLTLYKIPEYINFKYFYSFLKKNPSITYLILSFQTADVNNTFINDIQRYYSEDFTYETSELFSEIYFDILIGNLNIHASFYKICKNCNQGVANKFSDRGLCPSDVVHWICQACLDAFQPGVPCPLCLAGI